MAKRKFIESEDELVKKSIEVAKTLFQESDRGCVLVGAALIDEVLEVLLRSKLESEPRIVREVVNPLFITNGPLSSFWARIQLSYALGLINRGTYDDLEIIRNLRNSFAHQYGPVSLDATDVADKIDLLKSGDRYARAFCAVVEEELEEIHFAAKKKGRPVDIPKGLSETRIRFMCCTAVLVSKIGNAIPNRQ